MNYLDGKKLTFEEIMTGKPKFPDISFIYEGDIRRKCYKCGSSLIRKWFGFKLGGCIHPLCSNYEFCEGEN